MRKIMIRTLKLVYARSLLEKTFIGCLVGAYYHYNQETYNLSNILNFSVSYEPSESFIKFNMAESGAGSSQGDRNKSTQENLNGNNGLVLYYHHHSFYAQKVRKLVFLIKS